MNRHFYISDNLDDLESLEHDLEASGISTEQIHVLSENDRELERHHLHEVSPLLKKDLINSGSKGVLIGASLAAVVIALAYFTGWSNSPAGWTPFAFLALVLLGFCIWEGGFLGIQRPNSYFERFQPSLHTGKHVFFVDVADNQEAVLEQVVRQHPMLQTAGTGVAMPYWLLLWQQKWHQFKKGI